MAVNESKEHDHSHGEEDDHAHEEGNSHEDKKAAVSSSGQKCHFHAGVEYVLPIRDSHPWLVTNAHL